MGRNSAHTGIMPLWAAYLYERMVGTRPGYNIVNEADIRFVYELVSKAREEMEMAVEQAQNAGNRSNLSAK
ncbi:MAG: hypothetical protein H6Q52_460 [Deltaproteobacteria bacterium]|nr:hypothetical protein [Deltaproteobacteria bacterium]